MSARPVAVYNSDGEQLINHTSVRKAMRNLLNGKYQLKEAVDGKTISGLDYPKSVILTTYRHTRWWYDETGEVPFSKKGILRRDNYKCCYCGKAADTVDHVLPKWKNNAASWTNSVAACFKCNNSKGGRSPDEAGMKMRFKPYTPTFGEAFRWTHGGTMPSGKAR